MYEPTAIEVNSESELEVTMESFRLDQVTVGRIACSERVRLTTAVQNYHVVLPLTGVMQAWAGARAPHLCGPNRATVFGPGQLARTRWAGPGTQLAVMIPQSLLERTVERLLGRRLSDPLSFGPVLELAGAGGAGWRDVLWLLQREFERGESLSSHPVVARHLENLLMDGLLLGGTSLQRELLLGEDRSVSSRTVREAMRLIDEDPRGAWSTTNLAIELHVSVRSLQEGFKTIAGVPPMAYVRRARLERARDTLRLSTPETTTVHDVAASWGFAHMGRFASAYKERFGESPSTTLRGV